MSMVGSYARAPALAQIDQAELPAIISAAEPGKVARCSNARSNRNACDHPDAPIFVR